MEDRTATLQRELDELRAQITTMERDIEEKPDYGLGRGDPAITRWEVDRALLQQLKERAASLEQALAEISAGTYGICERCGNPIHPDRLTVLPDTRMCARCAQAGKRE
jgi:DnaK suppressor protein